MRFSILSTIFAVAAVVAAESACPAERPVAVCCNYANKDNSNPHQPIPNSCEMPADKTPSAEDFKAQCKLQVAACCVSATNYPRGYAGNNCVLLWNNGEVRE